MSEISSALSIDFSELIIDLFAICFAIKVVIDLFEYFKNKFGFKTKKDIEEDNVKAKHQEYTDTINKINEDIAALREWLEANKIREENTNTVLVYLARAQLIEMYNKIEAKGYMTVEEDREWNKLYYAYHNMGGNGTVTKLAKALEDIPIGQAKAGE